MSAIQTIDNIINEKMHEYYFDLYKNQLGLPHYISKINERLAEEELRIAPLIDKIEGLFNFKFGQNVKVLIIGGGTGGELVEFSRRGSDAFTIEPYYKALEIIKLKAEKNGIPENRVIHGIAETLPFADNTFDFIYCYTVIEHVQDVEKSISEAIRVTKPGGRLFFFMPDYRQPLEGHYKTYLPLFMPKSVIRLFLRLKKRPINYINQIQFVTSKQLIQIFRKHSVSIMRVDCANRTNHKPKGFYEILERVLLNHFEIERNQFWLLLKDDLG